MPAVVAKDLAWIAQLRTVSGYSLLTLGGSPPRNLLCNLREI
jgi:hypothetical protein